MLDNFECILDQAINAHENNELLIASELYYKILQQDPHHPDANHNLGLLSVQLNNSEGAILFLENAINANPNVTQYWISFADALIKLNRLQDAKHIINQAIELGHRSNQLNSMINFIETCHEEINRQSSGLPPQHIKKLNNLLGDKKYLKLGESISKLKKKFPNSAELEEFLGLSFYQQKKYVHAIQHYKRALEIAPKSTEYVISLGHILMQIEAYDDAIDMYHKASIIDPNNSTVLFNLAAAYNKKNRQSEAIKLYKRCLELSPEDVEAMLNLANIYADLDLIDEAINIVLDCRKLEPNRYEVHYNLGHYLKIKGDFEMAKKSLLKALDIYPTSPQANHAYATIYKFTNEDKHLSRMEKLIPEFEKLKPQERALPYFALGKAYEDVGEIEKSFSAYKEANQLINSIQNYDISIDRRLFAGLKILDEKFQEAALSDKSAEISPIFILGMPRSGTTLVEQIISSHSEVAPAGELETLSKFGRILLGNGIQITKQQLSLFKNNYLSDLKRYSNSSKYVTDKLPHNFRYISIINAVFSDAKIIHVKRDPAATCWSNFKHSFKLGALEYSYDLENVASFYKLYEDLMSFWEQRYPEKIYTLDYEELVSQPEIETKKLLDHIGLQYETACFNPHKNKRIIKTTSQSQARKKIYTGSSNGWKKFEPFLDGAFDQLR
jgi:tetratricopeptide (TPR) repeat protein